MILLLSSRCLSTLDSILASLDKRSLWKEAIAGSRGEEGSRGPGEDETGVPLGGLAKGGWQVELAAGLEHGMVGGEMECEVGLEIVYGGEMGWLAG